MRPPAAHLSGRVLIIEDDPDLAEAVRGRLALEGHTVAVAHCGSQGLTIARDFLPDLVLLDLALPDMPGTEVARLLQADPDTRQVAWVVVSGRDDEIDRVIAFELGATDYVVKPFSLRELALRVRAILRRLGPTGPPSRLRVGQLTLDVALHDVRIDGALCQLTPREFAVLEALMRSGGAVMGRAELLDAVWPDAVGVVDRTVDSVVMRLRTKLGPASRLVETVRGVGYRVVLPEQAPP
jgi:two-component system phosphate regulon response regulator PhoB